MWSKRLILLLLLSLPPSLAAAAVPPDIVILCEPTLRPALTDLSRLWRQQSAGELRLFASSTTADLKQAGYGARADVIFGAGEAAASAASAAGVLTSADLIGRWQDGLVLVTPPGVALPEGSLADRLAALRVAGIDGTLPEPALTALGLADAPLTHYVNAADSDDALALLDSGAVGAAVLLASDAAARPQLIEVTVLPAELAPPLQIWAGQSAGARSPEMAHFAAFLREPASLAVFARHGLQPSPP